MKELAQLRKKQIEIERKKRNRAINISLSKYTKSELKSISKKNNSVGFSDLQISNMDDGEDDGDNMSLKKKF